MRRNLLIRGGTTALLGLSAAFLVACAAQSAPDGANDTVANPSVVCDREITGSHFKRCSREDGRVDVMSADDLERMRTRAPNVPMGAGSARGR